MIDKLLDIVKKLRSPDGCPWDRKQTHKSLKRFLIEEAYESIEAIDAENDDALKEELGDVLLQVVLHAQIASERGAFDFNDIVKTLSDKLIARHPHVFGESAKLKTAEEVEKQWEKQKKRESLLDGLPSSMPPLLQVYRISERVSRVGFDWESVDDIVLKIEEELSELKRELSRYKGDNDEDLLAKIDEELGDLIFTSIQIARYLGRPIDDIIKNNIDKFIKRFKKLENYFKKHKIDISSVGANELNRVWTLIKEDKV